MSEKCIKRAISLPADMSRDVDTIIKKEQFTFSGYIQSLIRQDKTRRERKK